MKTTEIIFVAVLAVFATSIAAVKITNSFWEQEAVDNGVARYSPDTGEFEWTNVKILPQWEKIKQMVEVLDEQRKRAKFNGSIPQVMPNQQSPQGQRVPHGYQASSEQTI